MQKKKTQKTWIQQIKDDYHAEMKRLKRKKFLLKARLMLTVILPIFIVLLGVKVIKTFVRIKVRNIFAKPDEQAAKKDREKVCQPEAKKLPEEETPPSPVPARMTPVEKEIIQPVPAAEPVNQD